jgi:DHA2 family multidrug resistance protein
MLDRGESKYWFESGEIVFELILAVLAFYLFVVHIFTHEHSYIDRRLFRDRNFSLGLVFIFLLGVIMLATMALFPPYLQTLLGYPVYDAGLILAPRGVGTMLAMLVCSRFMERGTVSPRVMIIVGLMMIVITMWEMTKFTTDVTQSMITWTGSFQGFGLGLIFVPLSTLAFATIDPALRTEATSIFGLVRTIGSSIGISIVMAQLSSNWQREHAVLTEHITVFNPLLHESAAAQFWDINTPQGLALLEGEVARQALQLAYTDDFQLILIMALLAIPAALLLRSPN